jgi:hypothetical protein
VIALGSALPLIADPDGTVIDGKGANVTINGSALARALSFDSAPGVPLEKVTVANLVIVNVAGPAVHVCGGVPPSCAEDVGGVLLQNVVVGGATDGINVHGRDVSKSRVLGCLVSNSPGGILIEAKRDLLGARVQGTSVHGAGFGIYLLGIERAIGATVVDSLATHGSIGIVVQGTDTSGSKIADVVTAATAEGVRVVADGTTTGTTITNAVVSGYSSHGVELYGTGGIGGATVRRVRADGDGLGMVATGPLDGATFQDLVLVGNDVGLDLGNPSASNAKVSDAAAVDGEVGVLVVGGRNKLKNVHAAANDDHGIVVGGGGGNVVEKSHATGNGDFGIGLVSDGNVVRSNVALGHGQDLRDDTPDCGANVWQKNVFQRGSQPCIR